MTFQNLLKIGQLKVRSASAVDVQKTSRCRRARLQLAALDTAQTIDDMDICGFRLQALKGSEHGRWSVTGNQPTLLRQPPMPYRLERSGLAANSCFHRRGVSSPTLDAGC